MPVITYNDCRQVLTPAKMFFLSNFVLGALLMYHYAENNANYQKLVNAEMRVMDAEWRAADALKKAKVAAGDTAEEPAAARQEGGPKSLKEMRELYNNVQMDDVKIDHRPFGWFEPQEFKWLYTMGRYCPGPVLEQGPFSGLSTTAFAAGVRDADVKDGHKKVFFSADIFPASPEVMASTEEIGYPHFWKFRSGNEGLIDLYVSERYVGSAPELGRKRQQLLRQGLMPSMVGALNKNKLLPWVNVVIGAEYPKLAYNCAFFDTAHSISEVLDRLPTWIETVQKAGDQPMIINFHDYAGGPSVRDILKEIFLVRDADLFDRTWAIEVHGLKPSYKEAVSALPSVAEITQKTYDQATGKDGEGAEGDNIMDIEARRACNLVGGAVKKKLECASGFGAPMKGHALIG